MYGFFNALSESTSDTIQGAAGASFARSLQQIASRVAQCIDKEILIRKKCNIDIGIDIDKENFEKLIIY